MTTDRQDPAADATAEGVASDAALFVTFYSRRDKAQALYERLEALVQQDTGNKLPPYLYEPPAAHDTTVISLAINAPDKEQDAATAWENARRELEAILNAPDLPVDWWGYTLIYQAVLNPGVALTSVPKKLPSTARRPNAHEGLEPLRQADLAGGRLWLMGIPRGDGLAAAAVYVALSPSDEETAFKADLFGSDLTMLDLIAHKGYHLKREYSGDLRHDYDEGLKAFRKSTYELLGHLGRQIEETKVDDLAGKYEVWAKVIPELKRLRVSVAQQLPNYDWWHKQVGANSITEYHRGHLDTANQELELMVTQGQDALGAANTAMTMAQVQIDKARVEAEKALERTQRDLDRAQANRQHFTQTILAVAGAALAVPQLIDRDAAGALIGLVVPESWADKLLVQLGTQSVLIVAVALLGILAVWWINDRRRGRDDPGR